MAIYLARAVEYRIFKIGYSQTPESRVASISGGFPVEVTLHRVFEDGCRSDERNAHEHLRDFHVRAEWYSDEGLRVAEDLFEDLDDSLAKAGAECAAAIMRQYLPLSEVENFIATLEVAGATSIAAAFTNMPAKPSNLGNTTQGTSDMSCMSLQARTHIGAIVQFVAPSMPLKSALPRVAAYVGINIRRCRALWNRESRTILAVEIQQLEAARARISERLLTKDMHDHASHLEIRAARLATDDSNLHREEIARLRRMAQRSRDFASDLGA